MTRRLTDILPKTNYHPPSADSPWAEVDGHNPELLVHPRNANDVAQVISECARQGLPLLPSGQGHALDQGGALTAAQVVMRLDRLGAVTYFNPADLVISAQAGVPLNAVKRKVTQVGLHLALDPPAADVASVGGAVAMGITGAERHARGRVRDQILGLSGVLGDGTPFTAGGKVVKNVAGYDLCRLFTGSRGSLGVITEVTFKLTPLPKVRKNWLHGAKLSLAEALSMASKLANPNLDPLLLGLWGSPQSCHSGLSMAGEKDDVEARQEILPEKFTCCPEAEIRNGENLPWNTTLPCVRLAVPPSSLARTLAGLPSESCFFIDLLSGRADISLPTQEISKLTVAIHNEGGWLMVEKGPIQFRQNDIIKTGQSTAAQTLAQNLRKAFDPKGIMVPGRLR